MRTEGPSVTVSGLPFGSEAVIMVPSESVCVKIRLTTSLVKVVVWVEGFTMLVRIRVLFSSKNSNESCGIFKHG